MQNSQKPGYPTTLFAHYKNMINTLYADGFRTYTANELRAFVGSHENVTNYKRWNKCPYYTTRWYQTRLKHLGCITPIKRGLWKINAPIPEWFGSFHIKGLKGQLGEDCIYWNELDEKYKINPWKSAPIAAKGIMPTVEELTFVHISNIAIPVDAIPACVYTAEVQVIECDIELLDYNIAINGININDTQFESLLKLYDRTHTLDAALENLKIEAFELVKQCLVKPEPAPETSDKEHLYTAEQVMEMFIGFAEKLQASVIADVENAVDNFDAVDLVELDLGYDRSISVDLNTRAITNALNDTILDTFNLMRDEMQESFPSMNSKS